MNALFDPLRAAEFLSGKSELYCRSMPRQLSHANCPDACPNGGWWHGVPSVARICEALLDAAGSV